ncbi:unnamed protein product, partial [Prorocentrum cordatum]
MKKQVADSDSCADQAHAASRAERAARAAAEGRSREQLREVRLLRDQLDEKEHEIGILVGDLRRLRADLAESERGGSGLQRRSRTLDLDDLDDYARLRASARAEGRSAEAVAWGPSETPAAASQDAAPPVPCAWESADRSIGTLTAAELVVLREAKLRQAPLEATPPAAAAAAGTRGAQAAARHPEDAEGLDGTDGRNATPRASGTATPSSWAGGAWGLSPAAGSQRQARAGRSAATTPAEARCWEEGAPGGSATWAAGRDLAVAASAWGDEQQALRHWGQLAAGAGLRSAPRAAGASPRSHSPFGVGLRRVSLQRCGAESATAAEHCEGLAARAPRSLRGGRLALPCAVVPLHSDGAHVGDVLVSDALQGEALSGLLPRLAPPRAEELCARTGELLAELHAALAGPEAVRFDGFHPRHVLYDEASGSLGLVGLHRLGRQGDLLDDVGSFAGAVEEAAGAAPAAAFRRGYAAWARPGGCSTSPAGDSQ